MNDKRLMFYSLLDFFPKKENIKAIYQDMSLEEKKIYKMFVYSICFEEDNVKDLIWEYLNDWEESMFMLAKTYRIRKEKIEKRKRIEIRHKKENGQLE